MKTRKEPHVCTLARGNDCKQAFQELAECLKALCCQRVHEPRLRKLGLLKP